MEGGSIARQVEMGLRAVIASDSPVFLRSVAATGNDPLLGIRGTETVTDTELKPRPSIDGVGLREVAMSNGRLVEGDLKMIAAANVVLDEAMVFVFNGEEYRSVAMNMVRFGGTVVGYSATLRKRIRTD